MTEQEKNRETMQSLVDHFLWVQAHLKSIAEFARLILDWRDERAFEFQFDKKNGALIEVNHRPKKGMEEFYSQDPYREIVEDHKQFCIETAEIVSTDVQGLHEHLQGLEATLYQLPDRVHELLTDVRHHCWRPYVIRHIVIPLTRWPRLPSREKWHQNCTVHPTRPPIPLRNDYLLKYAGETDPTEYWQRIYRRITTFLDDIMAVARECQVSIDIEPDGPYGVFQWRYQGKITKKSMTSKQNMLAKYLHENLGKPVEICGLIGKDCLFENVLDATVQRHGSNISEFFVDEGFPLVVRSEKGLIWMEESKTEE